MAELVHLRLEEKMRSEIKDIVSNNMFKNESEFIRAALRNEIEKYRKIQLLNSLRNSIPEKKGKRIPKSDIFRAFGLE